MNIKNYQSRSGLYAELLAFGSFAIGTLLLGLRILMPDNHRLILVGFFFVLAAVLVNVAALLILLYHCLARFEYRR